MKVDISIPETLKEDTTLPALYLSESTGIVIYVTSIDVVNRTCSGFVVKKEPKDLTFPLGHWVPNWNIVKLKRLPKGTILTLEQS